LDYGLGLWPVGLKAIGLIWKNLACCFLSNEPGRATIFFLGVFLGQGFGPFDGGMGPISSIFFPYKMMKIL